VAQSVQSMLRKATVAEVSFGTEGDHGRAYLPLFIFTEDFKESLPFENYCIRLSQK